MADEKTTEAPQKTEEPENSRKDDAPLGEAGEKALDAFKSRARDAEKKLKEQERRLAEATERIEQFEEKDKSELEKLTTQRDNLKSEAATAKAENDRLRVALAKKLPTELIDRLKGDSPEELEADADELLKLVKPADATDFDGGVRELSPDPSTPEQAHQKTVLGLLGVKQS